MENRNVRIWVPHNGDYVRLTLRPGKPVETVEFRTTGEEYMEDRVTYTLGRGIVEAAYLFAGRDCDGRYESYGESQWRVGDRTERIEGVELPCWRECGESCEYDEFAQMAGY